MYDLFAIKAAYKLSKMDYSKIYMDATSKVLFELWTMLKEER